MSYDQLATSVNALVASNSALADEVRAAITEVAVVKVGAEDARDSSEAFAVNSLQHATESAAHALDAATAVTKLALPDGSSKIGHGEETVEAILNSITAAIQDFNHKLSSRRVSVKDAPWYAKGDATTDDTKAIQDADIWCAINGYNLYFPDGVYRITNGIDSYVDWEGDGAANVSTYNLTDDKVFMVQGSKHKLPGSNIMFDGAGLANFTTLRTDEFAVMRYAVVKRGRTAYRVSPGMAKMGIIANFNYKTPAGAITLPNNDGKADIDVGLMLHNVELKSIHHCCIGGYWKKAGIVHFGVDPDNTHLTEVKTMGNVGLAVIGDTSGTNSGLNATGCFISSNDHHSRNTTPGVEQWGRCALYIDIPSSSGGGSRNGISIVGGAITTKTNVVVEFGRCGAVNFTNVVFENATQAGSGTGQGQAGGNKRFIGTADTGDICFVGNRLNAEQITNAGALLDTAPNANIIRIGGNTNSGVEVWRGKSGVRIQVSATEQNIQMTADPASITSGIRFRRTSTGGLEITADTTRVLGLNSGGIQFRKDALATATVTGGAVATTTPVVRLSGGTVDLNTINAADGANRVVLIAATTSDIITLKAGTAGNLRIAADYVLSGTKAVALLFNGLYWVREE